MDPVAFRLFGLDVRWYGILIALGAVLAVWVAENLIQKNPAIPKESVVDYALYALPLGILGARLYYVLFEWEYYGQYPAEILAIRNGGLAIHGGILAGMLVAWFFARKRKLSFWDFIDMLAPGVVLAQGIGRWGNFMNGEAHGGPTDLPWAIQVGGEMVHPTFLYESILDVGIFLFLFFVLAKRRKFRGQLAAWYLILYGIGRFCIEGLRTDSLYIGPLRTAQLVSILGILFGLAILYVASKKKDGGDYRLIDKKPS